MKYGRYILAAIPALLSLEAAAADRPCCPEEPGWYAGISGMAVFLNDTDIKNTTGLFPAHDILDYKTGYGFSGNVGYRILPSVRVELEVTKRQNDVDTFNGVPVVTGTNTFSAQSSIATMANVYYDYHNDSLISPYIGAGIGGVDVKSPLVYFVGPEAVTLKGWVLGYQFMAGINYEVPNTNFELNFGYRYLTTEDLKVKFDTVPGTASVPNTSSNLEMGGRFYF